MRNATAVISVITRMKKTYKTTSPPKRVAKSDVLVRTPRPFAVELVENWEVKDEAIDSTTSTQTTATGMAITSAAFAKVRKFLRTIFMATSMRSPTPSG